MEREQARIAALEFIARINQGANPTLSQFKELVRQAELVENFIRWGRLP